MPLEIRDLSVRIAGVELVSIDELTVPDGRRVGLVGESGSGKTLTALSIVGLQPRGAVVSGTAQLDGTDVLRLPAKRLAGFRGREFGFVFQDPLRALNPVMRIGWQLVQAIRLHTSLSKAQALTKAIDLLHQVSLDNGAELVRRYPHQLSGGQRQRVIIALAISNDPRVLIADEPTTALDVTVQREVLDLLVELSETRNMSVLFVSHDLGVVEAVCDDVAVMYGGRLVEHGPITDVVGRPRHRYTQALIESSPTYLDESTPTDIVMTSLPTIPGSVPNARAFPTGCRFRNRCGYASDECAAVPREVVEGDHRFRCWNPVPGNVEVAPCR